jgi:hypothetical protein
VPATCCGRLTLALDVRLVRRCLRASRRVARHACPGLVRPHSAVAFMIRPLPPHFLQGAGKIRRPGWAGCFTFGYPVPSQASHFVSRGNVVFMQSFLNKIPAAASRLVLLGEKPELSVTRWHRNITALIFLGSDPPPGSVTAGRQIVGHASLGGLGGSVLDRIGSRGHTLWICGFWSCGTVH